MKRRTRALTLLALSLSFTPAVSPRAVAGEDTTPTKDTQAETVRLTTPDEARAALTVPEGFRVSLFASEPQVRQPIAVTTDPRGRLWVAENYTYAESKLNYDLTQHDRILILTDADHDGRAEKSAVFWDKGQKLTSVEVGFGGVWALCPPYLLFLPDRNHDDAPDGAPEVVLDGFDHESIRHNIANGLKWGPDGWLYGRHGIQATSYVGVPGTPKDQRAALNCSVWRYHPTRKLFEVVARGGTNSWGTDWDRHGELFAINTVIGHLWHSVPGAYGERMYGEHDNPYLYALMGQTADHYHWDTAEAWSQIRKGSSPTTEQAGGGHAHTGLLIYQGDNWPERYRGKLFTINLHGRRLNSDTLERKGAGYVGRHGDDFLKSSDPWFRPIDLINGNDGGVYLADWSDIGECHENDGVHRSSGRIYKVVHGEPARPTADDLSTLGGLELVGLQRHPNDWYARQARRVLQERAAAGAPTGEVHSALRTLYEKSSDPVHRLRATWGLYVTGGVTDEWLIGQLGRGDEHERVWAVRLLGDGRTPPPEAVRAFASMAPAEASGLVLLYLASTLQRLAPADRWDLAGAIATHAEFADDPMLPLLIWYGLEPAVPDDPARAVRLAGSARMPLLSQMIARRLTENLEHAPGPVDGLVALAAGSESAARAEALLAGMSQALRGRRKARAPASWAKLGPVLEARGGEGARRAREMSVVFGDGRALDDLFKVANSASEGANARRDALKVLVEARSAKAVPVLRGLLTDRDLGADAARGLSAFDDPAVARDLVAKYRAMKPPARAEAVVTLAERAPSAGLLLDAVASGAIARDDVPAFQVRQMAGSPDESVRRKVRSLWPEPRAIASEKRGQIDRFKAMAGAKSLAAADLSRGRGLFEARCATCHTLFGRGGKIGPDLTGAQRQNLEYLMENIVDPSATVANDYRISTVALADGRLLNGIVLNGGRTGAVLTVQTPTERLAVNRADVAEVKASNLSLMPDGLLDTMGEDDLRDLVAYLMSPQQVPPAADPGVGK